MTARGRAVRYTCAVLAVAVIAVQALATGAGAAGPRAFAGSSPANTIAIPHTSDAFLGAYPAVAYANGDVHVVVSTDHGLVHARRTERANPPEPWTVSTIAGTSSSDTYPALVARPNGSLVLAFRDTTPGVAGVFIIGKGASADTFPPVDHTAGSAQRAFGDSFFFGGMVSDSNGRLHVVVTKCGYCRGRGVYYANGRPGAWSSLSKIDGTDRGDYPMLAIDPVSDVLLAAYTDLESCGGACTGDDGTWTIRRPPGGPWSMPVYRNAFDVGSVVGVAIRGGEFFVLLQHSCVDAHGCYAGGLWMGSNSSGEYRIRRLPGTDRYDGGGALATDLIDGEVYASFRNGTADSTATTPRRFKVMERRQASWTDPTALTEPLVGYPPYDLAAGGDRPFFAYLTSN